MNKLDGKFANRVDSFIWHPRVGKTFARFHPENK